MAIVLFRPFIINKLVEKGIASHNKVAQLMCDEKDEVIWDILKEIIKDRPILLNRAPTLHRLGIQSFFPRLIKGKVIKICPLVTPPFNADFDGDHMSVHLPLSKESMFEARSLMLGCKNILGPKDGKPIVTPTQDMVLGNYYLTMEVPGAQGEGGIFNTLDQVFAAYENKKLSLHAVIGVPLEA
jgi:DNA-directed RNA polymerase subunit beta'